MSTRIPNLVWLGPRGAGKQTALHNFLQEFAQRLNQPFSIQIKRWQLQSSDGEGEITTSVVSFARQPVAKRRSFSCFITN